MTRQIRSAFTPRSIEATVPRSSRGPWALAEFGRLVTFWFAAFVMLVVAWAGSRSDANPAHGGRWILIGLIGGLLAIAGSTFWLTAGTRSVRAREQWIMARLSGVAPLIGDVLGVSPAAAQATTYDADGQLVRVENGSKFHRSDCLMVAGKPLVPASPSDRSLEPCGVCQP